jgi:hypothetical protein
MNPGPAAISGRRKTSLNSETTLNNFDKAVFAQADAAQLHIERLSDGSIAVVDQRSKSVHSLNPTAALAWDACAKGATVEQVRAALQDHAGSPVSLDVAWSAIQTLQRAELLETETALSAGLADPGRRSTLKTIGVLGGLVAPVVLSLTASQQKAYAQAVGSGTTTVAPTTTIAPTTTFSPPQ